MANCISWQKAGTETTLEAKTAIYKDNYKQKLKAFYFSLGNSHFIHLESPTKTEKSY